MTLAVVGSDTYKWLLAFHILLAVVWVGSNTAIQILVIRATRASADRLAYLQPVIPITDFGFQYCSLPEPA